MDALEQERDLLKQEVLELKENENKQKQLNCD